MPIILNSSEFKKAQEAVRYQPGYAMWKHRDLSYVATNDYSANILGYASADAFYGKRDEDVPITCNNQSEFIDYLKVRTNNLFKEKRDQHWMQLIYFNSGTKMMIGSEHLICDTEHNPLVSVMRAQEVSNHSFMNIGALLHPYIKDKIKKKHSFIFDFTDTYPNLPLAKRQSECLYHLLQGCSVKEIGQRMNISPRTVETHLERIKFILGCQSKVELIEKAIAMGLLNYVITG